jgi:hypothetical protein
MLQLVAVGFADVRAGKMFKASRIEIQLLNELLPFGAGHQGNGHNPDSLARPVAW